MQHCKTLQKHVEGAGGPASALEKARKSWHVHAGVAAHMHSL